METMRSHESYYLSGKGWINEESLTFQDAIAGFLHITYEYTGDVTTHVTIPLNVPERPTFS